MWGIRPASAAMGRLRLTYRQHPMGRSLFRIADAPAVMANPAIDRPQFDSRGYHYSVERRGDRIIHQEVRQDASGHTICQIEAEVHYGVGSGRQAFSYLIERDGFLFESPITWYAKDKRWGLSPGFDARQLPFREADPGGMSVLPCESSRARPEHSQPVSNADLSGPRHRL